MSAACALLRREAPAVRAPARGTVIALHADGEDAAQLLPLCAELAPDLDVVAPQAPRARNPFLSSASPDDPRWRDYKGYTWFRSDGAGRPEPASFGDSLWQLEQLAQELHDVGRAPLYLMGLGEGATLAAELAAVRPDLIHNSLDVGGRDGRG